MTRKMFPKWWSVPPSSIGFILFAVLVSAVLLCLVTAPAQASTMLNSPPQQDETPTEEGPDLTDVILRLEDMPPGYEELMEAQKEAMITALSQMGRLMGSGTSSAIRIKNATGYWNGDPVNMQMIVSLLISPLSEAEQAMYDKTVAEPDKLVVPLSRMLGRDAQAELLEGFEDYGESSLGLSVIVSAAGRDVHMDIISARRGMVVEQILTGYVGDQEPMTDVHDIARILDDRLAQVVRPPAAVAEPFRETDTLVPKLTTHIPTPLDISTDPAVVGTNLMLAAIIMILLTIAIELANRTLEENEALLQRIFRPLSGLGRFFGGIRRAFRNLGPGSIVLSLLALIFLILVYGLTFSLLEPGWSLLTITGFWLFLCLTIGGGIVGLADDVIQWATARRWGAPTTIRLRPVNLLLAFASTGVSRLFGVVPGFMFGSPQALDIDPEKLEKRRQTRLLWTGAATALVIGLGLWVLTILTNLLLRVDLPEILMTVIGGVESMFLSIFALAVQNAFVQMLDLPDTYGRALKRLNRWIWLLLFLVITFIFYHTLINPKGNLKAAWGSVNVKVFLITAVVGMMLSLLVWLGFRLFNRGRGKDLIPPSEDSLKPVSPVLAQLTGIPASETSLGPVEPAATQETYPPTSPSGLSGETKACPNCGESILAEAKFCPFCAFKIDVENPPQEKK